MSKNLEGKHFLNIHHRSITYNENLYKHSGKIEKSSSPGHFYVSLQAQCEYKYFGKYPSGANFISKIISIATIRTQLEEEQTNILKELEKLDGCDYLEYKSFVLDYCKYNKALNYALSKSKKLFPSIFILGFKDCTDFVQEIYHEAGLPLYFTIGYSKKELTDLDTYAANNVLVKYGSFDNAVLKFSCIESTSKEKLSKELNVDESAIDLVGILEQTNPINDEIYSY